VLHGHLLKMGARFDAPVSAPLRVMREIVDRRRHAPYAASRGESELRSGAERRKVTP